MTTDKAGCYSVYLGYNNIFYVPCHPFKEFISNHFKILLKVIKDMKTDHQNKKTTKKPHEIP